MGSPYTKMIEGREVIKIPHENHGHRMVKVTREQAAKFGHKTGPDGTELLGTTGLHATMRDGEFDTFVTVMTCGRTSIILEG